MDDDVDPAMKRIRGKFKASCLTLHQLGERMGFKPETARQAAYQFLKAKDPRISSVRRACEALGLSLEAVVPEGWDETISTGEVGDDG